jgi:hypothetical protein
MIKIPAQRTAYDNEACLRGHIDASADATTEAHDALAQEPHDRNLTVERRNHQSPGE